MIVAIDPGTDESAFVVYDGAKPVRFGKVPNAELLDWLRSLGSSERYEHVVVEAFQSFGMPVGVSVFETCYLVGRIQEIVADRGISFSTLYRKRVVAHMCGSAKGKDANVRRSLLDRFGVGGNRAGKGHALYGITKDVWSALAIATTWWDLNKTAKQGAA